MHKNIDANKKFICCNHIVMRKKSRQKCSQKKKKKKKDFLSIVIEDKNGNTEYDVTNTVTTDTDNNELYSDNDYQDCK